MPSPEKRRPAAGQGPKGAAVNGPRSPPRPSRPSGSSPRKNGGSNHNSNSNSNTTPRSSTTTSNSSNVYIAPPPRAALSGTSSPAPDHPRNSTTEAAAAAVPGASLHPTAAGSGPRTAQRNNNNNRSRSPSPLPMSSPRAAATPSASTATATTPSTAQTAALLREKDARIASLERELALMEAAFHRELDKLSSAESETAAFWQARCAALERQVAAQAQALAQGHSQGQGQGQGQDGNQTGLSGAQHGGVGDAGDVVVAGAGGGREAGREEEEEEIRELRAAWEHARALVAQRDEELAALRAQVRGLKEWVSLSTRADGEAQTSDEVFAGEMMRLGSLLQNWVLVHFRKAKLDLSNADEDTVAELARLVPMYEDLLRPSRLHMLQSAVSRLLVELVFDPYFVGLPSDVAEKVKEVESFLASSTSSPESVNQWRSVTLAILRKDAAEKLQTETSAVVDAVVSRVNKLFGAITNTEASEQRDAGLQGIVSAAIELSRLLAVQKAVFRVEMPEVLPHQRTVFDAETMEDVGGEDEDSLVDREICCVTFPGIVKRGDETGAHLLQYRNVIHKARVLCRPES